MLDSPQEDWMVSAMILAIWLHRRRIDRLLARLDTPGRSAVEAAVTALIEGSLDAGTLVARMSEGARPGEGRLRPLIELSALDTIVNETYTSAAGGRTAQDHRRQLTGVTGKWMQSSGEGGATGRTRLA